MLPYARATRHLVDAAALSRMQPTATLTNIARCRLADEGARAEGLAGGLPAAAGLDVFEGEPLVNPRVVALDNAVLTPDVASVIRATRRARVSLSVHDRIAALGQRQEAGWPSSVIAA